MDGFTEKDVFEAFALSEKAQEVADPAENTDAQEASEGEKGQEVADPAKEAGKQTGGADPGSTAETAEENTQEDGVGQESSQTQTPERRRENAARRRQAEQKQAVDMAVNAALAAERQKQEAQMKDFFAKAGLKNTATGEPITNMEQFKAWSDAFEQAKLERELKAGKLTPDGLATAIGNHPAIKQAQAVVQQQTAQEQARRQEKIRSRIDGEIAQIHALDASINTVEDLFKAPYGKELAAMVKRGYSLPDAHYLLNRDRLEQAKLEAARQQAEAMARSKDHLSATGNIRGGGAVSVPAADMTMFRLMNPGASDAEIQAYYNRYLKK